MKKFDFITKDEDHVHLTEEQIKEQKKIEESAKAEAAKLEVEVRKEELVNLLGPDVVSKYFKAKLQYDKYYDKMLNRITNYDVLARKGPITVKVYRENGTSEIIPNFKANDLHLGEWREVVKACPNKKRKGCEQDPLNKLNDLTNKKRKHANDIHDYFKANKRLKSSVQYEDHPSGTALNEPVLGMIMFNSHHMQDFVTAEDFKDFSNKMLYTIQEIFFRLHQGPGLADHARTFSSLLLAEVDKRNLNPLKQIFVRRSCFAHSNRERLLRSIPEPFSLSLVLNIKSLKYSQSEVQLESLKKVQLQFFRRLKQKVSLLKGLQDEKKVLYVKRNKAISLGIMTSKVGIK
nr:hypothetical protein [Tanacetum cinerariifolium]